MLDEVLAPRGKFGTTLFRPEAPLVEGRNGIHPEKADRRTVPVDCRKTADGFAALSADGRFSIR